MPFAGVAGAKTFTRTNGIYNGTTVWQQTEAAARGIRSDDEDTHDQDVATAVNTSLQRNGDNSASADIPFAGFALTGIRAGVANGETVRYEQVASISAAPMNGGHLTAAVGTSALTINVKYLDGNDPSSTKPVIFNFRNATAATGSISSVIATGALSLIVSSGSKLGTTNSTAFRVWVLVFNDAGTLRLGVIQAPVSTSFDEALFLSSTAEGGAGAADSGDVVYTGAAVTSKAFRVIGFMDWSSGLGTAGTWSDTPTTIQTGVSGTFVPNRAATFSANKNASDQAIASAAVTVVTFGTEARDVGARFASNAWTPPAGTALLNAVVAFTGVTAGLDLAVNIYKDGVVLAQVVTICESAIAASVAIQCIDQANGSNAYDIRVASSDANYTVSGVVANTFFQGTMIY